MAQIAPPHCIPDQIANRFVKDSIDVRIVSRPLTNQIDTNRDCHSGEEVMEEEEEEEERKKQKNEKQRERRRSSCCGSMKSSTLAVCLLILSSACRL